MKQERISGPTLHEIGLLEIPEIQPVADRLYKEYLDFFTQDPLYREAIINQHWQTIEGLAYPSNELLYTNKTHHIKALIKSSPKNKSVEVRLNSLDSQFNPNLNSRWDISANISSVSDIYKSGWLGFYNRFDPAFAGSDFIQVNTLHAVTGIEKLLKKLKTGSAL